MAVQSFLEPVKPPESAEGLVDWFLHRVQHDSWALGGAVVMAIFILGTLSLVVFALVYGCCCNTPNLGQRKAKGKNSNEVI